MKKSQTITKKICLGALTAAVGLLTLPFGTGAATFNPNYILSDQEMRDASAMSFMDIYQFLNERGSLNNQFDIDPIDGMLKGTAQLIDDAAKRYGINPKYVLTLLQKESSVVESSNPAQERLDWAAGYALCDGCYKNSELAQKYKGFGNQIDAGAGWMDWYMTNAPELTYLKQPGISYAINDTEVTPANLATAGLYNYTPHLHGNRLLWNIWQRWFGEGSPDIRFPDGTLLTNLESGEYALIQNGQFRLVTNQSVLTSRFGHLTPIELAESEFRTVEEANPGRPIAFADLALVRDENETVWLLTGNERRQVASDEDFRLIGFNPEEVEDVLLTDIDDFRLGDPITADETYPLGQLIQDSVSGGVYWVKSGIRHPIWDKAILQTRFPDQSLVAADPDQLEMMILGEPVIFPDGVLIKAEDDPTVYVIESGYLRPIPTEDVFLGYGYRWTSVITAGPRALALHPIGENLLLIPEDETVTATAVGL